MRRVVVTGLGMVSPLGGDVETSWKNIIASKSGAATITRFDPTDYKCRIACEVKPADHEYGYDPSLDVDHKIQRQVDLFIVFGISAASQALRDAGLDNMSEEERLRVGSTVDAAERPERPSPRHRRLDVRQCLGKRSGEALLHAGEPLLGGVRKIAVEERQEPRHVAQAGGEPRGSEAFAQVGAGLHGTSTYTMSVPS